LYQLLVSAQHGSARARGEHACFGAASPLQGGDLDEPAAVPEAVALAPSQEAALGGTIEVATVGFKVGYESPFQFSRKYRGLFGASPIEDAPHLRERDLI
jgi:AraC-like DNA-binding protein